MKPLTRRLFMGALLTPLKALAQLPVVLMKRREFHWYVDSVNGSDSNSGRLRGSAFATIAKLMEQSITPGCRIGLARGSHWREQLTVTASNLFIGSYGTGSKPLFDCSDQINSATWTKSVGRTNVYQCTIALPATLVDAAHLNVFESGSFLKLAVHAGNCDATPGSYFPSASTGSITLYIHTSASNDPSSNGETYEFSARESGIYTFGCDGVRIRGVAARRNYSTRGSICVGRNGILEDAEVNDGGIHNCYVRAGAVLRNVVATNAYYSSGQTYFVCYEADATGLPGAVFDGCSAINTGVVQYSIGFYAHATAGQFQSMTYSRCVTAGIMIAYNSTNTALMTITDCEADLPNYANSCGASVFVNTVINGLTVTSTAGLAARGVRLGAQNLQVAISRLVLDFSNAEAYGIDDAQNSSGCTLSVTDSEFSGVGWAFIRLYISSNVTATIERCTFSGGTQRVYMFPNAHTLTSDYNDFSGVTGTPTFAIDANTHYGLAAYRAATGQDAHSTPAP